MQILYIQTDSIITRDVELAFQNAGCSLIYQPAPPENDNESAGYLSRLLSNVKNSDPAFIFSLDFYPFLSLACGAMGLPYVAWLVKGYDADYYSSSIRNEWNYIFAMDSMLCQDLQNAGVSHCYYLPLAAPTYSEDVLSAINPQAQQSVDVSMIGSILERNDLSLHPLSLENALKDSTKGYLEGCIACQHQFHGMPSMSSNLPGYVWTDLLNGFPPVLDNSILSAQQFYDYNYFNPMITYADRDVHLNAYKNESRYQKIHLYSRPSSYSSENIINQGWADYYTDIPRIAQQSKINLVITHRNYRAGIPPVAWAIMAAKGFLLSNYQADYQSLFSTLPVLYQDSMDMLSKSAYYYHHEDERKDLTETLYQELIKNHTYSARILEMLSILS